MIYELDYGKNVFNHSLLMICEPEGRAVMKHNNNLPEELVPVGRPTTSHCLCIRCAVSENDFKERIAEYGGVWDGPTSPRASINGREYSLVYSPAPLQVWCRRCGEETHWAYQPDSTTRVAKTPSSIFKGTGETLLQ
jgi:hypothetical protein